MKKFLFILFSWVVIDGLHAQNEKQCGHVCIAGK